ncbi:hypothetical protein EYF80_065306 [Liparis tanakae]|uniref:Uncharacterized protein n=1 Tax=Liparis tanakae TaxID=230148 RepID=A0A4Z2E6Y3_9TELE|nr:hypothetical protein EYF80_065306 [Liparis tanakae]
MSPFPRSCERRRDETRRHSTFNQTPSAERGSSAKQEEAEAGGSGGPVGGGGGGGGIKGFKERRSEEVFGWSSSHVELFVEQLKKGFP